MQSIDRTGRHRTGHLISTSICHRVPMRGVQSRTRTIQGVPMASTMTELARMLTASEVADLLHLHVNTVKRLGDRGELRFYRVSKRGDRRFRPEDVMDFLARNH